MSTDELDSDKEWLNAVRARDQDISEDLSWAAYHAKKSENQNVGTGLPSLLPLWRETSKSLSMIKHALIVISKAVDFLNPKQVFSYNV